MPKPRPRQLLAGAVGPTEQAGTPDGDSEEGNNAGSEPPSPALRGDPGGTSDADSLLGWKALAGNAAAGSGDAGTCHLAGGPSPEEHAESKRVRRPGCPALLPHRHASVPCELALLDNASSRLSPGLLAPGCHGGDPHRQLHNHDPRDPWERTWKK